MDMTPDTLPLLAAAFSCIAVLAFFARRNRRTGWVKARISPDEVFALEANWKEYPAPAIGVLRPKRLSRSEVTDFTLQLAHFQTSLATLADSQEANVMEDPYMIQ